jgi:hypothetical protein
MLVSCNIFGDVESYKVKSSINFIKTKKAVFLIGEGNATVDISAHISIYNSNYVLKGNEVGNVFIADSNHGDAILDKTSINVIWIRNDTLQIEYLSKLRIFKQENKYENIVIKYKKINTEK